VVQGQRDVPVPPVQVPGDEPVRGEPVQRGGVSPRASLIDLRASVRAGTAEPFLRKAFSWRNGLSAEWPVWRRSSEKLSLGDLGLSAFSASLNGPLA
jgi:hypothetical protein